MHIREFKNLKRRLFWRLAIVCLIGAIISASMLYYREKDRLSQLVMDRVIFGLSVISLNAGPALDDPSAITAEGITKALDSLRGASADKTKGYFTAIAFRRLDGRDLIFYSNPEDPFFPSGEKFLRELPAQTTGQPQISLITLADRLCMLARIQMTNRHQQPACLVDGLFVIADSQRQQIRTKALVNALIIGGLVIAITAVMYPVIIRLFNRVTGMSIDLLNSNLATLEALGSAIAKRDSDTDAHNARVTIYSVRLAQAVGLNDSAIRSLIKGALLHDVGKIGIPDAILLKPGKLDENEFAIMKQHVNHGLEIVSRSPWLADAAQVVGSHHEKFDGSGYFQNLKGTQIPITARIFAIADVFDALTSKRPYKDPMPLEKALNILREGSGRHFDPSLLASFETIAPQVHQQANAGDHQAHDLMQRLVFDYFQAETVPSAGDRKRG